RKFGPQQQWQDEAFKTGPICRRVGEGIGTGIILDIDLAKAGGCVVQTDAADKTQLGGPFGEIRGRHVIAEAIPRPGKLPWRRRDFELRFKYLLVVIVARTQHHPVFAKGDRLMIVVGRNVSDAENRHSRPTIPDMPLTCISWAKYGPDRSRGRECQ